MEITNIKQAGSDNIIKWAINNNADILGDIALQSLINDETFFQVTIEHVHFLELFRLIQIYRDKVRILAEEQAAIPSEQELATWFPGSIKTSNGESKFEEAAIYVLDKFKSLSLQMNADRDIIRPEVARLFLPMLTKRYDIQIPVSFMDIVQSLSADQAKILFNADYPANIQEVLVNSDDKAVLNMLELQMIKSTSILRYDEHYETIMEATKYYPLNSDDDSDKLYKFKLIGFYKYDPVTRAEVRCSMFKPNKSQMVQTMKRLAGLNTELKAEFVVQLPFEYMKQIENYFGPDALKVSYESSMASIFDNGLSFNNFISQEFDEDGDEGKILKYNNAIDAYRNRIKECDDETRDVINGLLDSDNDIDITAAFALLPVIYNTTAVFTVDMDYADAYISMINPEVVSMFQEMLDQTTEIENEIKSMK